MESSYPLRPGEPDCRDYLRTGRCKYGESCKYNHPSNVEVGGGVKPINPGEPLFPIRPNEPPCQYFLKHGTCKFGQSCKFNHPSGVSSEGAGQGVSSTGLPSGLVFLTTTNSSTYTIDSNGGLRHSGSAGEASSLFAAPSNIQILPQRPSEPNCIYFLRNGRCKYGPTCKFHHPIETATAVDRRRSNSFSSYGQSPRLHPITEQRGATQKPTHILLPDGQIAVIIDPQSLQQVNEVNVQPKFYISPIHGSIGTLQSLDQNQLGVSPMLTATTTSSATVSSSFQTLESTMNTDMWGNRISNARSQGNSASAGPVHGSGTSLSAYGSDESIPSSQQGQYQLSNHAHINSSNRQPWSIEINESQQHQNEVNISLSAEELYEYEIQRRRAASVGAATEPLSSNYPSNASLSLSAQLAYERSRFNDASQSNSPYRPGQSTSVQHSFNRHASPGRSHMRRESEDGLTEMTSALLTMMDHHDSFEEIKTPVSHNLTPQPERMIYQAPQSVMPISAYQTKGHYSQSEPNIYGRPSTPARPRPPPGMTSLAQAAYQGRSFEDHLSHQNHNSSRPPLGGNYIQPSISPSWGENAPRF
ncbi:hypothetical protein ACHAW6_005235 [Cyclotella cf. meneghiniana]